MTASMPGDDERRARRAVSSSGIRNRDESLRRPVKSTERKGGLEKQQETPRLERILCQAGTLVDAFLSGGRKQTGGIEIAARLI